MYSYSTTGSYVGSGLDLDYFPKVSRVSYSNYIEAHRLTSINWDGGRIEFVPQSMLREDYNDRRVSRDEEKGYALDSIAIYDYNNNLIKSYKLNYTYFESYGDGFTKYLYGSYFKCLILTSFVESGNGNSKPPYTFEYNPTKLPRRNSVEIDFWEYYKMMQTPVNGLNKINRTNFYVYPDDFSNSFYNSDYSIYPRENFTGDEIFIDDGHDRTPNFDQTKAYILEKMIYPTGGYDALYYELNEFNLEDVNRIGGGLRIKQIVKHDGKDTSINILLLINHLKKN